MGVWGCAIRLQPTLPTVVNAVQTDDWAADDAANGPPLVLPSPTYMVHRLPVPSAARRSDLIPGAIVSF